MLQLAHPPDDSAAAEPAGAVARRSVATGFADLLADLGVCDAFGVTGGPIARFVHALEDHHRITWHMTRSEGGAALAAVGAWGLTTAPVAVVATCGPGVVALHQGLLIARSEGAHLVVVSPRTPSAQRGRRTPQDSGTPSADFTLSGPLFDYVAAPESVDELAPVAAELSAGLSRRGRFLAHLILPSDLLGAPAPALPVLRRAPGRLATDASAIDEVVGLLAAHRFFILAGRGARQDAELVRELASITGSLVVTTPGAKGVADERSRLAAGSTGIGGTAGTWDAVRAAAPEFCLVLGSRLSPASVATELVGLPSMGLVHVDRDPSAMGPAWPVPTLAVESDLRPFLEALIERREMLPHRPMVAAGGNGLPVARPRGRSRKGVVRPRALMRAIQEVVLEGSVAPVFVDVGSIWPWATSCLAFSEPRRLHLETAVGSMGLAVAGGAGAAMASGSTVVVLTGDWSFDMALPEVRTAIDNRAPVVWVVLQTYGGQMVLDGDGAIHGRAKSSASFPRHDLAGAIELFGGLARRVTLEADLRPVLAEAMTSDRSFLVEVVSDTSEPPPYGGRFDALRAGSVR